MSYIDNKSSLITQIQMLEIENELLKTQIKNLKMSYWIQPTVKENRELTKSHISIAERIIARVCEYYQITNEEIRGISRKAKYIKPRYIAIHLIKRKTTLKLTAIADLFGRDHTTIIYAVRAIDNTLSLPYDTDVKDELQEILNLI